MWAALRHSLILFAACWSLIMIPAQAYASSNLGCAGGQPTGGEFFETSGSDSACNQTQPVMQHIFSWIACSFIKILNEVLAKVYCGLQDALTPVVSAFMTAYVVFFGGQILTGSVQLTAKEVIGRLVKISLVVMFIGESDWGIKVIFNFFADGATEGTKWVLSSVLYAGGGQDVSSFYGFLDQLVYNAAVGPFTNTNSKVIGFFASIMGILPCVWALVVYWFLENLRIVAMALRNYMLGLSALAFLMSLAPIFMSLMLFQSTYHFFESWLKYMTSYALQIIVVFACVAMWLAVMDYFIDFFNQISLTIVENKTSYATGLNTTPVNAWGICEHGDIASADEGSWVMVKCTGDKVIPISKLPEDKDYVYVLVYNLMSLGIVAYAFSALVQSAPGIAQQLAGPEYVPTLAQGFGFKQYGQISPSTTKIVRGDARQGSTGMGQSQNMNALVRRFVDDSKKMVQQNRVAPKK